MKRIALFHASLGEMQWMTGTIVDSLLGLFYGLLMDALRIST